MASLQTPRILKKARKDKTSYVIQYIQELPEFKDYIEYIDELFRTEMLAKYFKNNDYLDTITLTKHYVSVEVIDDARYWYADSRRQLISNLDMITRKQIADWKRLGDAGYYAFIKQQKKQHLNPYRLAHYRQLLCRCITYEELYTVYNTQRYS